MTDPIANLPKARVKPASNWSAIWILPIIALLIGGWLGWKAYTEAGVMITIEFPTGDGLQEGKTELLYKGISLGTVKTVNLDEKTQKVHVRIEVDRNAEDFLREQTVFWMVKPNISLAGVTGLETLVSGNYIAMHPGGSSTAGRRATRAACSAQGQNPGVPDRGQPSVLPADPGGRSDQLRPEPARQLSHPQITHQA